MRWRPTCDLAVKEMMGLVPSGWTEAVVKEVLKGLALPIKTPGPGRGLWELRPEYKIS